MAKKVILIILGILLGLCGIGSLCGGGALLGIGGTSGNIQSGFHTLSTPTVGFVTDPAQVQNSSNVKVSGTSITLKIDGQKSTKPLFFGVGPTDQVDAYLSGAPYEKVTSVDFSPFALTKSTVDGATPPAAPGDQAFWVAQATGANPQLSWKIATGNYEAVLMNADGSPGVAFDGRIGVKAPVLGDIGLGLLIGGIVAAIAGLALLIWGIRTKRRVPLAPAGAYPGTAAYPAPYQQPTYPPAGTNWQAGTAMQYPPGSNEAPPSAYPPPNPYPASTMPSDGTSPYSPPAPPSATPPSTAPPAATPPSTTPPSTTPPSTTPPSATQPDEPPSTGWQPRPPEDPTRS